MREFKDLFILSVLVSLVFVSCSDLNSKRTGDDIKEIMKSREIKKVSDVDILNKAMDIGKVLADSSQAALGTRLVKSVEKSGIAGSFGHCQFVPTPISNSMGKTFNARFKRTSRKLRNKSNKPDRLEEELLEAYQYSFENDLEMRESVQFTNDGNSVLFTRPILADDAICLSCHGHVGNELSNENNALIKLNYQDDSATGFKLNDLRGMWSIKLGRKEIINVL